MRRGGRGGDGPGFLAALRFRLSPEFSGDAILQRDGKSKPWPTLDARCKACRVKGGRERPCWPSHMRVKDNPHGYPCPRREWPDYDSPALAAAVRLGASGETAHLFERHWAIEFSGRPRDEQRQLLRRLLRAYGDEAVRLALWPKE